MEKHFFLLLDGWQKKTQVVCAAHPPANLLSTGTENSVPLMWGPEDYMLTVVAQAFIPPHPHRTQTWLFVYTSDDQLFHMIPNSGLNCFYPATTCVIHDRQGACQDCVPPQRRRSGYTVVPAQIHA